MKWIQSVIIMSFIGLLLINVYIVVKEIDYANKTLVLEKELIKLQKENSLLEERLGQVSSLEYIASQAARLNFVVKIEPVSVDTIKQAYKN